MVFQSHDRERLDSCGLNKRTFGYHTRISDWSNYYRSLARPQRKEQPDIDETHQTIAYEVMEVVNLTIDEMVEQSFENQEDFELNFLQATYQNINRLIHQPQNLEQAFQVFAEEQLAEVLSKDEIRDQLAGTEVGDFWGIPIELVMEHSQRKAVVET